jgi:hypothetical protein
MKQVAKYELTRSSLSWLFFPFNPGVTKMPTLTWFVPLCTCWKIRLLNRVLASLFHDASSKSSYFFTEESFPGHKDTLSCWCPSSIVMMLLSIMALLARGGMSQAPSLRYYIMEPRVSTDESTSQDSDGTFILYISMCTYKPTHSSTKLDDPIFPGNWQLLPTIITRSLHPPS